MRESARNSVSSERVTASASLVSVSVAGIQDDVGHAAEYIKEATGSRQTALLLVAFPAYLILACAIYMPMENWSPGDCIYYAVVVLSTVGYGDYLPTSDGSKVLTILFVHFGLVIVATAVSILLRIAATSAAKRAKAQVCDEDIGIFDEAAKKRRLYTRAAYLAAIYLVLLLLGMIGFAVDVEWGEGSGDKWLNGLYLATITLTTVGFGDFSPTSSGGKFFACVLMLIGIPAFGASLAALSDAIFGDDAGVKQLQVIQGGLTEEKFASIDTFVRKMRDQGLGNYAGQGDGSISRFEYMCFMIVSNKITDLDNLKRVMSNFEEVNVNGEDFITLKSLGTTVKTRAELALGTSKLVHEAARKMRAKKGEDANTSSGGSREQSPEYAASSSASPVGLTWAACMAAAPKPADNTKPLCEPLGKLQVEGSGTASATE
eukprot:TRINITY_DN22584_c0_g2_i1.p1 TRINITY_DN22584_c0_g2~~TRINITY_DN22584_c0_g2_i1.p1  ORF type:complete len:432 (+),score=63.24 TRINITY_DN22584_c0_g2_i1:94-1389(+)